MKDKFSYTNEYFNNQKKNIRKIGYKINFEEIFINENNIEDVFLNYNYYLAMKRLDLSEKKVLFYLIIKKYDLSYVSEILKISKKDTLLLKEKAINHFKENLYGGI